MLNMNSEFTRYIFGLEVSRPVKAKNMTDTFTHNPTLASDINNFLSESKNGQTNCLQFFLVRICLEVMCLHILRLAKNVYIYIGNSGER